MFLLQLLPPSISSSIASSTTASSSRPQPADRVRHLQLHHDSSTTRGNHHQQQHAPMERPPHRPWGWRPRQAQPDRFRWSSREIIADELDELDSFTRTTPPDRPWGWRPHQTEPDTWPTTSTPPDERTPPRMVWACWLAWSGRLGLWLAWWCSAVHSGWTVVEPHPPRAGASMPAARPLPEQKPPCRRMDGPTLLCRMLLCRIYGKAVE